MHRWLLLALLLTSCDRDRNLFEWFDPYAPPKISKEERARRDAEYRAYAQAQFDRASEQQSCKRTCIKLRRDSIGVTSLGCECGAQVPACESAPGATRCLSTLPHHEPGDTQ